MKATKFRLTPEWAFRISLAIIYIWFGLLKTLDLSPASALVEESIFWWDMAWFMPVLGIGEAFIGITFLVPRWTNFMLVLVILHLVGSSLTPMFTANELLFVDFPFVPHLAGQYIIKNLLILSGAYYLWWSRRAQKNSA